jgi:hypothetical protein
MPYKEIQKQRKHDRERLKLRRKRLSNRLKNQLGYHCVKCWSIYNVEFHHRIYVLRNSKNHTDRFTLTCLELALKDYKKDSTSLFLLCDDCHKKEHGEHYERITNN